MGARAASREACTFAYALAKEIAHLEGIVVSGGAIGVDAAAHQGALDAGGETWCVLPCGPGHYFPSENVPLFKKIETSEGALVWPFAEGAVNRGRFLHRNGVLVAAAQALVVIEANPRSGSLNAASYAHKMHKPVHIACSAPWLPGVQGWHGELDRGAIPIRNLANLLERLGFRRDAASCLPTDPLLRALAQNPMHIDDIAEQFDMPVSQIQSQLLAGMMGGTVECSTAGIYRYKPM